MGFGPVGIDPQQSLNDLIGKIESPPTAQIYMAKDYSEADFRRDIMAVIKTLVEILDRGP